MATSNVYELVERVPDGEHDVVAVLKPEDLPRRKVRGDDPNQIPRDETTSFTSFATMCGSRSFRKSPEAAL